MTDRELLEKAAKAAGYTIVMSVYQPGHLFLREGDHENRLWNPLTDDGDALRLAVKLGITVCRQTWFPDPYAVTRRAIVRAAAALVEKPQV
jgi:hypothetical protein